MSKVNMHELFAQADSEGFAIPAFNYSDVWDLLAIIEAAEEEQAPIILACHPMVIDEIPIEMCSALGKVATEMTKTPVIHHLDHGAEYDICKAAIDNGFPSVMVDGSALPLAGNIECSVKVVEYAHQRNVFVEGEIGKIRGGGVEGGSDDDDFLVDVTEAETFAKESGVDSLAIGIGNAHGFYVGKPELNFKRLQEVNEAVHVPLVLHGGTGIPEADIQKAIKLGIKKINVGTNIFNTYMTTVRKELALAGDNPFTTDITVPAKNEIKKVVKKWIHTCMANGKA